MKIRYEVFPKETFDKFVKENHCDGQWYSADTKEECQEWCRQQNANVRKNQIPYTWIICEVRYEPVFEIATSATITTTEKGL